MIQNYQESEAQKFKTNRFSFVRKECNQSIFAVFKNLSVKTRVDGKVPLSKTAASTDSSKYFMEENNSHTLYCNILGLRQ